jgi:two-component system, OmpR family, phosphate regulon sensor histidine kinase PhoR
MSKRAIWLVIVFMTIGLLGSSLIQVYWFNWSMKQQEARFDINVIEALNKVEERLSTLESKAPLDFLNSLSNAPNYMIQQEIAEFVQESGMINEDMQKQLEALNDSLYKSDKLKSLMDPMDNWKRQSTFWEILDEQRRYHPPDISERIDPKMLTQFIDEELKSRGINLPYQYGVIQASDSNFIIINGNYVVGSMDESSASHVDTPESRSLFTSKYQVALYRNDIGSSPGWLKLHFPNKQGWLWYSILPTLLAAILFTALILICFSYTIHVILRQKKISEMKTDFINNMTHEFKTPIATISLAADSIASPKVINDEGRIKRFIGIIRQENKRMLQQVEKVLQMALIDKSDFELKISDVDIHEVIRQAVDHLSLQVHQREGNISMQLEAEQPVIEGDQTHLSSVIHNLLDNANKYSAEAPDIAISTFNVNGGIQINVADKGIGMSKEDQKHIFDKFFRVHTGNLHDVKGFGLGLSYVKAITMAHQGNIEVKSEPGKGSKFSIYLPVRQK